MKSKLLTLFGLAIFSLIILLGLTSAAVSYTSVSGNDQIAHGEDVVTVSFNLLEDGSGDFEITDMDTPVKLTSGTNEFFSATSVSGIAVGAIIMSGEESGLVSLSFTVPALQPEGTYTGTLNVSGDYGAATETYGLDITINVEEIQFCDAGALNDTDLVLKVDITNRGDGDDNEWLPLDIIEIEVELENNKEIDLDDVVFELGLFKKGTTTNIIDDMTWISDDEEKVEVGNIKDGKDELFTFEFKIDPDEVEDATYVLVIKAYPDKDEDVTCIDYSTNLENYGASEFYAEITIDKENEKEKMVIIDKNSYPAQIDASCSQSVMFSADIYNIGDRNFDDQMKVTLYNEELNVDLEEILLGDIDAGDKKQVTFSFNIPKDAEEKQYTLYMRTYYDYDEKNDLYDELSEDLFPVLLKVEGNCVLTQSVSVSASLESEAIAGEQLIVKAIITNTADKALSYTLNAAGYTSWAPSASLSESIFTLAAGESKEVLITFSVDSEASGEQLFSLEVLSEGQLVYNQPVSVLIEKTGFSITGSVIGDNPVIWGVGLLNLILILVIIILAVKVSKR